MERREFLAVAAGSALAGCSAGDSDGGSTTAAESPETRLRVQSAADREYEFTFELLELQTATVVHEEVRTLEPGDAFSLDEEFSPGTDYRFVVRRAGRKLLNFSVYSYEGYVVTVRPGPKVEVTREVEM